MGCFSSRFDKRNSHCQDLNTVGLQFVGGESHDIDGCPVDKFIFKAFDAAKANEFAAQFPTEGGKATNEDIVKAAFLSCHKSVSAVLKEHKDALPGDGGKDVVVGGKYTRKEAISQLEATLESFQKAGIEVPAAEAPKDGGGEEEKKGEEEEVKAEEKVDEEGGELEKVEYDGGEEEEEKAEGKEEKKAEDKAGGAMEKVDPRKYEADAYAYEGWAEVPALFLRNAIVNEYWGDLVKAYVVDWEFNPEKAKRGDFDGAAALIEAGLSTAARDKAESWFSGHVGEEDFESLKAMADKEILFPGWVNGWASAEEATQYLAVLKDDVKSQKVQKAIFHVTDAPVMKFAGCRNVAFRLQGKITKYEEKDGVHHFEVAGAPAETKSIADWLKEKAAPPVTTAAVVDNKEEETGGKEEEEKAEEEEKKADE